MKLRLPAIFLLSIVAFDLTKAAPLERSVSPSQQFIVFGGDASSRGGISDLAETTRNNLLKLLRRSSEWKTPIVINLQQPQANIPEIPLSELRFSQTGFGLKLQLDLTISANGDHATMERELLRAILLEMIYRDQPGLAVGSVYVEPPAWLLDGVLACAPGRDRDPLIEALAVSDKVMPLADFLRVRPEQLDSPARLVYRAHSFALVQLLINDDNARRRLGRYIDNLSHASNDLVADLTKQFPELAGTGAAKIWKAEIARLRVEDSRRLLSFAETEKKLEELLATKIGNSSLSLREMPKRKLSPADAVGLKRLSADLLLLATRANPILRPTIQDYQEIATLLARGKTKGTATRLAQVETMRTKIAARMNEVDDYLNWFEATQSKTNSGEFVNYLGAAEQEEMALPHRRDAISVYLDALEGQF
jgi:hypothetical protein